MSAMWGSDPADGCKRFAEDIAMHWYPPGSVAGDHCYCGERTMQSDEDPA